MNTTLDWTGLYPKYAGKWIALADDHLTVVSSAKSLKSVMTRAQSKGYANPLIYKVPDKSFLYVGQL